MRWPKPLFWITRSVIEAFKLPSTIAVIVAATALAFVLADQASTRSFIDMWRAPVTIAEQLGRLGVAVGRTDFQSVVSSPSLLIALFGVAIALAARVLLGLAGYALRRQATPAAKQQRLLSEMDRALKQAQSA